MERRGKRVPITLPQTIPLKNRLKLAFYNQAH